MKCSFRLFFGALFLVISSIFLYHQVFNLSHPFSQLQEQIRQKYEQQQRLPFDEDEWPSPQDKIVVMAKMKHENTDWVAENLPDWQHAIYHMDDPLYTSYQVPVNKGREAMAYLTYLIDHYTTLPSTIAFMHSHRDGWPGGWHTDAPGYDNVQSLRDLQLSYVQEVGYANLRCIHIPGCPDEILPFRNPVDADRVAELAMAEAWRYMFVNDTQVPQVIGVACCSQFAVSRQQVHQRPVEDYIRFRQWLINTELEDQASGRVIEYLWHIYFGRDAVHCPALDKCYCSVYGRC